jgi:signal transduction histidine kinase
MTLLLFALACTTAILQLSSTTDHTMNFNQRYQAALQSHLSEPSTIESSSVAAHLLGQEAAQSGMDVLNLVRTHEQAMIRLTIDQPDTAPPLPFKLMPGGSFLLDSLAALEESVADASTSALGALMESERLLKAEVSKYDQLLSDSRRLEEQARLLAHQILLAQEEERREISRELHDEVAQILAGINVRLAALRESGVINFQNFETGIQLTQQMIEESMNVVHRYARKLRPAILDDLGLKPALRSLIKDLPRSPDLEVCLECADEVEALDKMRRTVLYRVAHEALLNVIRHAEASTVTVRLEAVEEGIRLTVQDDGKAFSLDALVFSKHCKRLGLLGMKERVEMVDGNFAIVSEEGKGTLVSATIPFARKQQQEPS